MARNGKSGFTPPTDDDYAAAGTNRNAAAAADTTLRSTPTGGGYRGAKPDTGTSSYNSSETETSGQFDSNLSKSGSWWGGLDLLSGAKPMSESFGMFSDMFGQEQQGQAPGSYYAQQMSEGYNPYATGAALGKGMTTMPGQLGQADWFSNQVAAPGSFFMDPVQIVSGTLQQLAQIGQKFASGEGMSNNMLDGLVNPSLSPYDQLNNIMGFLGEALKGSMNDTALQNYLGYLEQMGMSILSDVARNGVAGFGKGGGNMATALMKAVGPTGGL